MGVVLGIILWIIAIIVVCVRAFSTQPRLEKLLGSERKKLKETLEAYRNTKSELGELGEENCVKEELTIMGNPRCEEPLISPLGRKPCVYYTMTVTATRKERRRNSDGEWETHTDTETLASDSNSTRFTLDDGTDSVVVDPKDGDFDGLVTTVNKSEVGTGRNGSTISFGDFSLSLSSGSVNPETIHYEEQIIGLDRPLTVVGCLCDKMGDLMIENHEGSHVLVSTKSHEEMIKDTKDTLQTQKIIAIGCGIAGLVAIIIGLC